MTALGWLASVSLARSREGTYSDPAGGRGLRGDALAGYMNGLWAAFPDLSFEIASACATGLDSVAAEWIMRGTNLGSMMGLPPTGKSIQTTGADLIRTRDVKIQSVEEYFDNLEIPYTGSHPVGTVSRPYNHIRHVGQMQGLAEVAVARPGALAR